MSNDADLAELGKGLLAAMLKNETVAAANPNAQAAYFGWDDETNQPFVVFPDNIEKHFKFKLVFDKAVHVPE